MSYGRTPRQELLLEGRRLLSRHYYGDGRWGWRRSRSAYEQRVWRDWRVAKHRPRTTVWARSTATKARKVHAVRYALTATHATGDQVHLTVWLCGQHANSAPCRESHPRVVCAGCHARLSGVREVVLDGAA